MRIQFSLTTLVLSLALAGALLGLYVQTCRVSDFSQRLEDMASDVRMLKEVLNSVHHEIFDQAFSNFSAAYSSYTPFEKGKKVLRKVDEIQSRGRYSRVTNSH